MSLTSMIPLAIGTISYSTPDLRYLIVMHLLYVIEKWAYGFKKRLEFWTSRKSF